MGRHHWEQNQGQFDGEEPVGRFRLLLGRGALICVVLAVLAWLSTSLLLSPRGGGLEPLAEVPLAGTLPLLPQAPPGAVPSTRASTGQAGASGALDPSLREDVPAPTPSTDLLVIHVAGAVRDPGIYKLPSGARAYEAIEAAGGLDKDADASSLNLAALVQDATRLYVPRKGEQPGLQPPGTGPGISQAPPGSGEPDAKINVNTADAAALQELPGIGPALAANIIDFRSANGPFSSVADLDAVSGIGPVMLKRLEPLVGFR
ncbi:ComEA family DNA-binding protein [Paeniglutamicibacter cryotolerans]|uniref:Competence protein ComEA n=1 Tax=Paeniglutamicibacter cryotolerans TaxID=670079 RepID=A0A839QR70_9MICC|nr:ComEA family DNA-binding protein [Paeniglutamicibacter cryotolerans]MBB2997165.1 competence protein ComEA [Paeniglutamicibacter cryotolerans]